MSEHPTYRNRTNGAVSYGDPTHWQHPEDWEPVHVLTYDDLARIRAEVAEQIAARIEAECHPPDPYDPAHGAYKHAARIAREAT